MGSGIRKSRSANMNCLELMKGPTQGYKKAAIS